MLYIVRGLYISKQEDQDFYEKLFLEPLLITAGRPGPYTPLRLRLRAWIFPLSFFAFTY
jgi:hypothetical protein